MRALSTLTATAGLAILLSAGPYLSAGTITAGAASRESPSVRRLRTF